jgi:benzoyl-CoA reductase/2-hydroxyglutaryl-CoA dehydratase subunit BcrC/BadD/HgdB
MTAKKDYKNDLPSLRRQNLNLLKEREILRDEVRILTEEREDRCKKLTELWGNLTDIKRLVEMVREVPPGEKDWDGLVDAVDAFCNDYVRLDVSEHKLNDRISDIRRELMAEKSKSLWTRIKERFHAKV